MSDTSAVCQGVNAHVTLLCSDSEVDVETYTRMLCAQMASPENRFPLFSIEEDLKIDEEKGKSPLNFTNNSSLREIIVSNAMISNTEYNKNVELALKLKKGEINIHDILTEKLGETWLKEHRGSLVSASLSEISQTAMSPKKSGASNNASAKGKKKTHASASSAGGRREESEEEQYVARIFIEQYLPAGELVWIDRSGGSSTAQKKKVPVVFLYRLAQQEQLLEEISNHLNGRTLDTKIRRAFWQTLNPIFTSKEKFKLGESPLTEVTVFWVAARVEFARVFCSFINSPANSTSVMIDKGLCCNKHALLRNIISLNSSSSEATLENLDVSIVSKKLNAILEEFNRVNAGSGNNASNSNNNLSASSSKTGSAGANKNSKGNSASSKRNLSNASSTRSLDALPSGITPSVSVLQALFDPQNKPNWNAVESYLYEECQTFEELMEKEQLLNLALDNVGKNRKEYYPPWAQFIVPISLPPTAGLGGKDGGSEPVDELLGSNDNVLVSVLREENLFSVTKKKASVAAMSASGKNEGGTSGKKSDSKSSSRPHSQKGANQNSATAKDDGAGKENEETEMKTVAVRLAPQEDALVANFLPSVAEVARCQFPPLTHGIYSSEGESTDHGTPWLPLWNITRISCGEFDNAQHSLYSPDSDFLKISDQKLIPLFSEVGTIVANYQQWCTGKARTVCSVEKKVEKPSNHLSVEKQRDRDSFDSNSLVAVVERPDEISLTAESKLKIEEVNAEEEKEDEKKEESVPPVPTSKELYTCGTSELELHSLVSANVLLECPKREDEANISKVNEIYTHQSYAKNCIRRVHYNREKTDFNGNFNSLGAMHGTIGDIQNKVSASRPLHLVKPAGSHEGENDLDEARAPPLFSMTTITGANWVSKSVGPLLGVKNDKSTYASHGLEAVKNDMGTTSKIKNRLSKAILDSEAHCREAEEVGVRVVDSDTSPLGNNGMPLGDKGRGEEGAWTTSEPLDSYPLIKKIQYPKLNSKIDASAAASFDREEDKRRSHNLFRSYAIEAATGVTSNIAAADNFFSTSVLPNEYLNTFSTVHRRPLTNGNPSNNEALEDTRKGTGKKTSQKAKAGKSTPHPPPADKSAEASEDVEEGNRNAKNFVSGNPTDDLLLVVPSKTTKIMTEYFPQEIHWLVQQYVKKAAGYFAFALNGQGDTFSNPATMNTNKASAIYFQAVEKMKELMLCERYGGKNSMDLKDMVGKFLRQSLAVIVKDAEQNERVRAFFLAGVDSDVGIRIPEKGVTAKPANKLKPEDVFKQCVVPLSNYDDKLQRSVERSFTKREREHVLQQILMLQIARAAMLLPPSTSGNSAGANTGLSNSMYFASTTNINNMTVTVTGNAYKNVSFALPTPLCSVEEMITPEIANERLTAFASRFGEHLCNVLCYDLEAGESEDADDKGETAKLAAAYSVAAENIHPPRRAVKLYVAGIPVPSNSGDCVLPFETETDPQFNASRQQSRVWLHTVRGSLSLETYTKWSRWLKANLKADSSATTGNMNVLGGGGTTRRKKSIASVAFPAADTANSRQHTSQLRKTQGKQGGTDASRPAADGWKGEAQSRRLSSNIFAQLLQKHLDKQQFVVGATRKGTTYPASPSSADTCSSMELKAEHREVLYPFCDALLEVTTTNISRVCRYIKSCDLTAALHFTISPPPLNRESSQGGSLSERTEKTKNDNTSIYFNVRFDDGLLFTCTKILNCADENEADKRKGGKDGTNIEDEDSESAKQNAKRLIKKANLEQLLNAEKNPVNSKGKAVDSTKNTVVGGGGSKSSTKGAKDNKRSSNVGLGSAGTKKQSPDFGEKTDQSEKLKLTQSSAVPPLSSSGCVSLWNTEYTTEGTSSPPVSKVPEAKVSLRGSSDATGKKLSTFAEAAPQKTSTTVDSEQTDALKPLNVSLTTNNFLFEANDKEQCVWMSYFNLFKPETDGLNRDLGHFFKQPETIYAVHFMEPSFAANGNKGNHKPTKRNNSSEILILPSFEVEARRSVDLSNGTVTRFFLTGVSQILFPDGSVLIRYPEDKLLRSTGSTANMDGNTNSDGGVTLEDRVIYETLTLPSGSRYARRLSWTRTANSDEAANFTSNGPEGIPQNGKWDNLECLQSFVDISATYRLQVKSSYNAMHSCYTLVRSDGASMTFYYHKKSPSDNYNNSNEKRETKIHTAKGVSTEKQSAAHQSADEKKRSKNAPYSAFDIFSSGTELSKDDEAQDDAVLYARVVLHADGTTITTFANNESEGATKNQTMNFTRATEGSPNLTPSWVNSVLSMQDGSATMNANQKPKEISSIILPLITDAVTVSMACGELTKFCVEAPRMPRLFIAPTNLVPTTFTSNGADAAPRGETQANLPSKVNAIDNPHCYYAVFGDGTVLQKALVYRASPAALVAAQQTISRGSLTSPEDIPIPHKESFLVETTLSRPTDTAIRIVHAANLVIVEPADVSARNIVNEAAAVIGEGYPMFDLALGQVRMVDYRSHIAEIFHLFSSKESVVLRLRPSNWESILRSLASPFYSPHRIPAEKEKEILEMYREMQQQEKASRAARRCPSLIARLRELTEGYIVQANLLKPDVLHRLLRERFHKKPTGNAAASTTGGGDATATAKYNTEFHSTYEDIKIDNIFPIMFAQLANGGMLEYMTPEKLSQSLRALEAAESDPVFLSRSIASGEPGTQQLSLFRIPNVEDEERRLGRMQKTLKEKSGAVGNNPSNIPTCHAGGYGAIIKGVLNARAKLSNFFSGTTTAASYTGNANQNGRFSRHQEGSASQYIKASSRWLPPSLQPPRRFIQGKKQFTLPEGIGHPSVGKDGSISVENPKDYLAGIPLIQESSISKHEISTFYSGNTYDLLCVFLQFEDVTPAACNVVMQSTINRQIQIKELTQYNEVMRESFPLPNVDAQQEQLKLQEVYHTMRRKHKLEKQRLKDQENNQSNDSNKE